MHQKMASFVMVDEILFPLFFFNLLVFEEKTKVNSEMCPVPMTNSSQAATLPCCLGSVIIIIIKKKDIIIPGFITSSVKAFRRRGSFVI